MNILQFEKLPKCSLDIKTHLAMSPFQLTLPFEKFSSPLLKSGSDSQN